ncbi:MAG: group III truncated hemoglobin [Xanthomonadaceae bacterium]|nr:group III truncated hemoglobin [Xanthomonadaceae bacterium]
MTQQDPAVTAAAEIPDAAQLAALVDRFYDRIQVHPQLGPIFNAHVHDWPAHKQLLTSFWCSVVLRAGSYRGNPMAAHFNRGIETRHFVQWLALWRETADDVLSPAQAALVHEYAQRIGRSLRYGLGLPEPRSDVVALEVLEDAPPRAPRERLPRGG